MAMKYWMVPVFLLGFACATQQPAERDTAAAAPAESAAEDKETTGAAEPGTEQTDKTATAAAQDKEKKPALVCSMEHVVGTHFKKRVCRTREQIERDNREAEEISRKAGQASQRRKGN